ncbi:MAG: hypothetical protein KIT44_01130 [Opitutaceae bacterium]|nr:hypothetical protein [Opitutaceae bacterium]
MDCRATGAAAFVDAGESALKEPPIRMPDVEVVASAPLIKVAEWRLLQPRFAPAAVVEGDYLYVIGGANGSAPSLDTVERVDIRTGKSEVFARLKIPRLWHQAVVWGGELHVLGGDSKFANVRRVERSVEVIDLKTGKVRAGPRMPLSRREFGCVVLDGKLYVIGGQYERNGALYTTNRVAVLDLQSEKWVDGPPMPTPRSSSAVLVAGNFIIVPGGFGRGQKQAVVEVLNPEVGKWSQLPSLSEPRSAHTSVFIGNHIVMFGDYDHPDQIMAYDLRSKESAIYWLSYKTARHAAAVAAGHRVYAVGGIEEKGGAALDTIQVFERPSARR